MALTIEAIEDARELLAGRRVATLREARGEGAIESPPPGTAGYWLGRLPRGRDLCEREPRTGALARLRDAYHGQADYLARQGHGKNATALRVCSGCAITLRSLGWRLEKLGRDGGGA